MASDEGSTLRRKHKCHQAAAWAVLTLWSEAIFAVCVPLPAAASTEGRDESSASSAYAIETPPASATEVRERFTSGQVRILEKLNRADRAHLHRLQDLIVPQAWEQDTTAYSPFPTRYGWGARQPKLLVVHQPSQAFAAYEHGRLVRWGPISSGRRRHQTPAGLFHLTWRAERRRSTINPDWLMRWYFNFHNDRGLSLHAHPLPGAPASHACVRLLQRHARWLFAWGEEWALDERGWKVIEPGTPVLILGCYDFETPPERRSRAWLSRGIRLPANPPTSPFECGAS